MKKKSVIVEIILGMFLYILYLLLPITNDLQFIINLHIIGFLHNISSNFGSININIKTTSGLQQKPVNGFLRLIKKDEKIALLK